MKIRGNTIVTPIPKPDFPVYNVTTTDGAMIDDTFDNVSNAFFSGKVVTLTDNSRSTGTPVYICTGMGTTGAGIAELQFSCVLNYPNVGDVVSVIGLQYNGMLSEAIYPLGGTGGSVELDTTLSVAGKAADAKAVGDRLTELAANAGKELYEAKYDPENEHLLSNFQEMEAAFLSEKIVTLSANTPDGVKFCFYCTQHNTEENSGYEGATLTFSRCTANYIETLVVESGGAVIPLDTNLYNLKTDVNAIKEDMGDIDAALDAIIAIQNSLIGGDGA